MAFSRERANGKVVWYAKFKDASGTWQVELCKGGEREAKRLETQRKREVRDGEYRKGASTGGITLEGYAKEWLGKRRNKTKSDDEQRIRDYVLPALGKRRMRDLTAAICIEFVRGLVDRGVNPKTISNVWGALRTMLRDSGIDGVIGFAPVMPRGIIPARTARITNVYDNAEVLSLVEPSSERGMGLFCAIAFYTGMREGEICGLKWRDWDDSVKPLGSLVVERQYSGEGDDSSTKTGRIRVVPVHPLLAEKLRTLEAVFDHEPDSPIVPLRPGEHHSKSTAYKAFRRHCAVCRVKSLGIHRTRHTAITAMRRGGVPAAEVERVTHNSTGTIVDRYTHDWTILCAAVSAIDYSSRALSRVANPQLPSGTQGVPGSIPGASTGQDRNSRDNRGQTAEIGGPEFSGIPVQSAIRAARHENLHRDVAVAAVTASDLARTLRDVLNDMMLGAEDGTPLPESYGTAEDLLARFRAQVRMDWESGQAAVSEAPLPEALRGCADFARGFVDGARSATTPTPELDRAIIHHALEVMRSWDSPTRTSDFVSDVESLRSALVAAGYLDAKGGSNG